MQTRPAETRSCRGSLPLTQNDQCRSTDSQYEPRAGSVRRHQTNAGVLGAVDPVPGYRDQGVSVRSPTEGRRIADSRQPGRGESLLACLRAQDTLPERSATILDCGANVGIFSVWAARQKPAARIIALEPFPETFVALQANIRRNLLADRVECAQLGLAGRAGDLLMSTAGESPNRKLVLDEDNEAREETVSVPCISLAECLTRFDIGMLDMLKMDIEGGEWAVLLSSSRDVLQRIRHIQLEYHEVHARFGYQPEQLFSHLAAAGHRLTFRTEDRYHTGMAYFERRV